MRARLILVLFAISASAFASQVVDPAVALDEARKLIAEKKFDQAATLLAPAADGAAAIENDSTRRQALAAVHFYSAVAWSGAGEEKKAKAHLSEFFTVSPDSRTIDPKKYDARFVNLFQQMAPSEGGTFHQYYPAFAAFQPDAHRPTEAGTFGNFPAMLLLATSGEKREWGSLIVQSDRERFIEAFWKKRDPMPATEENEFRNAFERRVAYADKVFAADDGRGAMTDRGKVFVLLGEPALVRRRPLTQRNSREQVWLAYDHTMLNGTIEQWVYERGQLPVRIAQDQLLYRFVNQVGIGDYVLQQENAFAMQVLATAGNPAR
jgi:GWxTD domain-containing protein